MTPWTLKLVHARTIPERSVGALHHRCSRSRLGGRLVCADVRRAPHLDRRTSSLNPHMYEEDSKSRPLSSSLPMCSPPLTARVPLVLDEKPWQIRVASNSRANGEPWLDCDDEGLAAWRRSAMRTRLMHPDPGLGMEDDDGTFDVPADEPLPLASEDLSMLMSLAPAQRGLRSSASRNSHDAATRWDSIVSPRFLANASVQHFEGWRRHRRRLSLDEPRLPFRRAGTANLGIRRDTRTRNTCAHSSLRSR